MTSSGTPTRRPRWPPAAGTGSLSTGTENSINVCGTEKSMYWRPLALSTGTEIQSMFVGLRNQCIGVLWH